MHEKLKRERQAKNIRQSLVTIRLLLVQGEEGEKIFSLLERIDGSWKV